MGFLQEVDLVSGTRWDPEVVETALDQAAAERQQLLEEIRRSVRIGVASTENPENVVAEIFYARQVAEDSASAAQEYAGIAVSSMDAAALSAAAAGLSESNAAGSEAAAAISAGAAYVDATTAESARDTAVLKAEEAAASAAIAGAALNADAWSASVNYIVGDVVYTTTGKTYRCIDPNINNNPDTDDGSDWFLMSLALGEASNTAYRGDRGKTAYDHSQVAHAPSDAQKNSDILKSEIEAKLIGLISSHEHTNCDTVDGYHAQKTAAADRIPVAGTNGKLAVGWLPELNSNPVHGTQTFIINGTFTVPAGVTALYVMVHGGGGSGASVSGTAVMAVGNTGGTTSFGSIISAYGGQGGQIGGNGSSGGKTAPCLEGLAWRMGFYSNGANNNDALGGSASVYGNGGAGKQGGAASPGTGHGSGGGGSVNNAGLVAGGGGAGGSGTAYVTTSPGASYAVTIGGGGGSVTCSNGKASGAGAPGFVQIWW
jgi:hypothetical protein